MSIYCPLSEALGIESGGQSVLNHNDEFTVYDPTITSQDAIKRNSEFINCPHCGVLGNRPNMMRWHFDNCKTKLKDCPQCGKVIPRQGCKDSIYNKKVYCSQECYNESKKGKSPIVMTPEIRSKMSKAAKQDAKNRSDRMKKVKPWKVRWNISE